MKRLAIASLLAISTLAAQAETYIDKAWVRSAEPQYENIVVPRNECSSRWINEPIQRSRSDSQERSYNGAIVGGLAGGVLGRQVVRGKNKDAATVVGAVLGAFAGDRFDNRDQRGQYEQAQYNQTQYIQPQYENVQREVKECRVINETQARLTGFRVVYDYRGQQYTTFTRANPGNSLPVRVSVEPVQQ
jgi:uncharacterized protein YcfJ